MRSRSATGSMRMRGSAALMVVAGALASAAPAAGQDFDVVEATIAGVHAAMEAGDLTCRGLVQAYLDRIEAYDELGPRLNTVQTVNPYALEEADALDEAMRFDGPVGPLHCVPVLLKDQVETRDMPTTYGSALFQEFVSQRDATIVVRLREAGAIILAKTNMGEFASRYVGSAFGVIRNAYDPTRNPSGSSGPGRHRRGHGRLHPRSGVREQPRGSQADAPAGEHLRHDACEPHAGHHGPHDPDRPRRGHCSRRHRRVRSQRRHHRLLGRAGTRDVHRLPRRGQPGRRPCRCPARAAGRARRPRLRRLPEGVGRRGRRHRATQVPRRRGGRSPGDPGDGAGGRHRQLLSCRGGR